jgi:hypothetical protein
MAYLILIVFISALAVLFYTFSSFDHLVRAEYESDRKAWEADGRPRGFFWEMPECTWFRSGWAGNRLGFIWLFTTPAWVANSETYRTWLKRFRIGTWAWNIFMLVFMFILIVFAK